MTIQIHGLESFRYCETMGLSECFKALAKIQNDCVLDGGIGFNPNSGYVYIALEEGITIASMLGRDVEYIVTDYNDGEEFFFDTYKEAETKLEEMNKKPVEVTEYGHLTVRLSKQDAKRFKRAAEDNSHTNQSGLIEAINRLMVEWSESPVADHGTAGKKQHEST